MGICIAVSQGQARFFRLEICGFHGAKGNSRKSSTIRNVAGLTAIASLGLLGPAPFATAASYATSSPTSTLDAIASGVITNVHGQVDSKGEIYVFALPDQSKLVGARAGVTLPLTLVGYARTNAHGQYAVTARPSNLMTTNGRRGYVTGWTGRR